MQIHAEFIFLQKEEANVDICFIKCEIHLNLLFQGLSSSEPGKLILFLKFHDILTQYWILKKIILTVTSN